MTKACLGAATLDCGDMRECVHCQTRVAWDLVDHPFFGFASGCQDTGPKPVYCPHLLMRFTIKGRCKECAPEIHAEHEAWAALWQRTRDRYRTETGREPLADWAAFETWLERNR